MKKIINLESERREAAEDYKGYLIQMDQLVKERAINMSMKCHKWNVQPNTGMSYLERYKDLSISWCPVYKSNTRNWRKFIFEIDESLTEVKWFEMMYLRV